MWILLVCSPAVLLGALVEYKFWLNYGELFYDYSGNSHYGRNGPSEYDTTKNVYYTDRGAYFNSQSVIYAIGYTYYPNPSTVLIWMNANTGDGRVYSRWDPNFCILVSKTSGKIEITKNDNGAISQVFSSSASWASSKK